MDFDRIIRLLQITLGILRPIARFVGQGRRRAAQGRPARPTPAPIAAEPAAPPSPAVETAQSRAPRRALPLFPSAVGMLLGAVAAAGTAYFILRQRQQAAARRAPLRAPFPEELLEVLAAPGGGRPLYYAGDGLLDPDTGAFYPIADGIPDFGAERGPERADSGWLLNMQAWLERGLSFSGLWGGSREGTAALAGAVAQAAGDGWCLSAPCGVGADEVEMARANPDAKILGLDASWERVLEARRRALQAGLVNLYFARGDAQLLPFRTGAFDAIWTADGFHLYPRVEQAMVELARAAKPGASVAGVSIVLGGPRHLDRLMLRLAPRFPGLRDVTTHLCLLAAAGLRELRAVRDGGMVRFAGVKGNGHE